MTILNGKLWVGLSLLVAALISGAAAAGGVELALASLGAMVLIGIIGISIYALVKLLRHSGKLVNGGYPACAGASVASFNGNDLKHFTDGKPNEAGLITEEDKRLIMEHIGELFAIGSEQNVKESVEAGLITEEDKRLIMKHVEELFEIGGGQSLGRPS